MKSKFEPHILWFIVLWYRILSTYGVNWIICLNFSDKIYSEDVNCVPPLNFLTEKEMKQKRGEITEII